MLIILNNIIILSMDLSITVRSCTHIITYCIRYMRRVFPKGKGRHSHRRLVQQDDHTSRELFNIQCVPDFVYVFVFNRNSNCV